MYFNVVKEAADLPFDGNIIFEDDFVEELDEKIKFFD